MSNDLTKPLLGRWGSDCRLGTSRREHTAEVGDVGSPLFFTILKKSRSVVTSGSDVTSCCDITPGLIILPSALGFTFLRYAAAYSYSFPYPLPFSLKQKSS